MIILPIPSFSWQFSLPFFIIFILLCINIHPASSRCPDDQRALLLELKTSLLFDTPNSNKLVHWDPNKLSDCCQWNGVQCRGPDDGILIGLDLSGEGITNGINDSSSLFQFHSLQILNLANNSLNARMPSGFSKLVGLTYLNLSNAGFWGPVPMELSRLNKLVTLDLSCLPYFQPQPLILNGPNLATFVQNLTGIRELYLDGVNIAAAGSEWCEPISSSLPELQVLSLTGCNLTGNIDNSLAKLESLSVIHLDQNNLSVRVPRFLAEFKNLTSLVLSSCGLIGDFPQGILLVPTLQTLDLSDNPMLRGSLPEFLRGGGGSLRSLILSYTNFSGIIPDSIGKLSKLSKIDLLNCHLGGKIPSSMAALKELVYLDFSSNNFVGPLPPLSEAKNLAQLILPHNRLSGSITATDWANLSNLENLDLRNNSFAGSIPVSLFSIPSLKKLQLSQNNFSGGFGEHLNISSPMLDTIDLGSNRLEGSIPNSVFELKSLKIIKLASNRFNGTLQLNVIQRLANLSSLELSYNNLSVDATKGGDTDFPQLGTLRLGSCNLRILPSFLRNQSKLAILDLSDNHIGGTIPRWIWNLGNGSISYLNLSFNSFMDLERPLPNNSALLVLDIHSNQLQGELPVFALKAFILDYSENNFSSIIPPDIGKALAYSVMFSLANNNISGTLPESLCSAGYIHVLDLSNNQLHGKIPSCMIKMAQTLVVLNLRGNRLSGEIDNSFTEACSLETLDLNGNRLQGLAPRSLENCTKLGVLDLGKNNLRDTFPCWLTKLQRLRVLVLRSNKFHGSIACPENNSLWPMLQIVDLASNNFDGELNRRCFRKWPAMTAERNETESFLRFRVLKYEQAYYQDVVTVTMKGSEFQMQKILTLFTSIDFSSNSFSGEIPETLTDLKALLALNLSYNALSGNIPSTIGNLRQLESLDFSNNKLSGVIPQGLQDLNFIGALNLSFNKLKGAIPRGRQLQTFDESSYIGNEGLCGIPLGKNCTNQNSGTTSRAQNSSKDTGYDLHFILVGIGFGTGAAVIVSPLMFWRKGRKWYDKLVDKFFEDIVSPFGIAYTGIDHDEGRSETEDDIGNQLFVIRTKDDDDEHDDIDGYEKDGGNGRFCVFCTKLDVELKKVVHNPTCTCHGIHIFSSSSTSSSSSI